MNLESQFEKMVSAVSEFQEEVLDMKCRPWPCSLPEARSNFRVEFLKEELREYEDAYKNNELAAQIDAIVDLVYVAIGMLLEIGVDPWTSFSIVHQANMKKQRGVTERGDPTDAVKPDGFEPPDHEAMLKDLKLRYSLSDAFIQASAIREERGRRYNGGSVTRADHFPYGTIGFAQILWLKAVRLRSEIESGNFTKESLSEHLLDSINYESFFWEWLNGGVK